MRKKDLSKETKIQDAVAKIILTEGAQAVSTTRVAKMVGIAQSNVYLYFKNKEELIDSVFKKEQEKVKQAAGIEKISDENLSLPQRVNAYLESILHFGLHNPDCLILLREIKYLRKNSDKSPESVHDNTVVELLTTASQANLLKKLPASFLMSVVFNIVQIYSTGVKNGIYTSDEMTQATVLQVMRDAICFQVSE